MSMSDDERIPPWRTPGEASAYPPPHTPLPQNSEGEKVSMEVRGKFVQSMTAEDQVFRDNTGVLRTVLAWNVNLMDGTSVEMFCPTELVVAMMERSVQHIGYIYPYQIHDAPRVSDEAVWEMMEEGDRD